MDAVVDVLVDMLYVVIALMFVCKFAKMLPLTNIMLHCVAARVHDNGKLNSKCRM